MPFIKSGFVRGVRPVAFGRRGQLVKAGRKVSPAEYPVSDFQPIGQVARIRGFFDMVVGERVINAFPGQALPGFARRFVRIERPLTDFALTWCKVGEVGVGVKATDNLVLSHRP